MQLKNEGFLKYSIIALGISSISSQIILLRIFLSVFLGNELILGIILANWMLLTALGSYFGKFLINKSKIKISLIIAMQFCIAVFPILTGFSIYLSKSIISPPGLIFGITEIMLSSFIILLPYCFFSGALFTVFSFVYSESCKRNLIFKTYSLESLGSIIGGLVFSIVLVFLFEAFQSLKIFMLISLMAAIALSFYSKKSSLKWGSPIISAIIIFVIFNINFDKISTEYLFPGQNILFQKETPYGKMVVSETDGQINFYENGNSLFSLPNVIENEELVHYSLIQHDNPEEVLLISGGVSGIIREIEKYDIKNIDYVEINPDIIDIAEKHGIWKNDEIVNVWHQDARLFVKNASENIYDVVLINLQEPNTAGLNRFYTNEFFGELKRISKNKAVIALSLPSTANYFSEEAKQLHSVIYNTLKTNFDSIIIIPGERNYFIASDGDLSLEIVEMINKKKIENTYVNQYFIQDNLLKLRSEYLIENLDASAEINYDFKPVSYYRQIVYWMTNFGINSWYYLFVLPILIVFMFFKFKTLDWGMFGAGFSASSIEFLLLISFQIIYGYVYQMLGIIITVFMIGLAIGAAYFNKFLKKINLNSFIKIQTLIGLYCVLFPFIILLLNKLDGNTMVVYFVFFLLTLIISILTGLQFSLASKIKKEKISVIASETYAADLLGSAAGMILVSVILFPLLGIVNLCLLIGGLNFLISGLIFLNRGKVN
ncbi:MAG: fused MFS/spermidine synthase [Bacteroidales bacterium]|nr:fused MFS/spermidine synthase [Bacteroidales bacterium]